MFSGTVYRAVQVQVQAKGKAKPKIEKLIAG
jgi:hypothetical protein